MTAVHLFELKWLYDKYKYMLVTNQHIPNTDKWKFIDQVCKAFYYSTDLDKDISESDLRYIHNCIIPGFIKGMTDGEIRVFEDEKAEFLSNNTTESINKSFEEARRKEDEDKKSLEDEIKSGEDYYKSEMFEDILRSCR